MRNNFNPELNPSFNKPIERGLQKVAARLAKNLERDALVQKTADELREFLQVDRVVLYYFYREWKGQVTFESLSTDSLSIFGSTGADECFTDEYARLYKAGRCRAIADVEQENIHSCHQEFLRSIQVRANLVMPILVSDALWGLLIAHHCRDVRVWSELDIAAMRRGAEQLAIAPSIREG